MTLLFEDRYGRYREVAEVNTYEEAATAISAFLKDYNFKSYYTRNWIRACENGYYLMFDVGSHSEFFCIKFDAHETAENFLLER